MANLPFEITLESLQTHEYTKKQLQDENVKYNLARCENELKEKSLRKLKEHLEKLEKNKKCFLQLDGDAPLEYKYPPGKTRLDLNKLLNKFFSGN